MRLALFRACRGLTLGLCVLLAVPVALLEVASTLPRYAPTGRLAERATPDGTDSLVPASPADVSALSAAVPPQPIPHLVSEVPPSIPDALPQARLVDPAGEGRIRFDDRARASSHPGGGPHITGTVTKASDGLPVAAVRVSPFVGGSGAFCCSSVGGTFTNASGNYTVNLPGPGTYRLLFIPPAASGLASRWWTGGAGGTSFTAGTDIVVAGTDVTRDVQLATGTGFVISGTVSATAPASAAGIRVNVFVGGSGASCATGCDLVAFATTGSGGAYAIPVANGTYRLRFDPADPLIGEWFNDVSTFAAATDIVVDGVSQTGKDASLQTGIHITGTVTDGLVGIANVNVQAYGGGSSAVCCSFVSSANTNSSGVYSLLVPPSAAYRLRFSADPDATNFLEEWFDHKPRFELATDVLVGTSDVPGKNAVLATGFRISGTVTDGSGSGVASVSVQAYIGGAGATCCTFVAAAQTNSSGVYGVLVPNGTYRLRFAPTSGSLLPKWWPNANRFDLATDIVVAGLNVTGKNATLASGFIISGTVTAASSGAPLENVSVNAYLGGTGAVCCAWITGRPTNASGQFSLLVPNGTYRLQFFVTSGSFIGKYWPNASRFDLATDIVVNGANVAGRDAALATGFRISGVVTDASGTLLQNVAVHAYTGGAGATCCTWVGGANTDAAGTFGVVVPNGTYRLQFYPRFSAHLAEWWNDAPRFDLATDIVVSGADVPGKNAVLGTGFRISGTVTDASSNALEGVSVSAFFGGSGAVCCTWLTGTGTNASGQYVLLVPEGSFRLHFFPRSGAFIQKWWPNASRFDLASDVVVAGGDVSGKNAVLGSGFRISGTLTDSGGPLANVSVNVFQGGAGSACCTWLGGTLTDAAGQYGAVVPNGTYRLLFYPFATNHLPEWWNDVRRFEQATDIAVSGADVTGKDAVLTTGFKIAGTITDSFGVGIEGVFAAVFQGGTATCCTFVASGRPSDGAGRYAVFVPNGTYRVMFFPQLTNHVPKWWPNASRFELATDIAVSGADATGKDAVLASGLRISGTVTDEAGAPLEGAFVMAFAGGAGALCCTFVAHGRPTDASGRYSVIVPNGTYRLRFATAGGSFIPEWWNDARRFDLATDIVVSGADVTGKNAALATGFRVTGTVTAVGGGALQGVFVSAYVGGTGAPCCLWITGAPTDAAGLYTLLVPSGTYRLRFFAFTGSYVPEWWDDAARFDLATDILVSGADVTGKNAALATGFRITGTVTNVSGTPIEGISVNAYQGGTGATCCTWIAGAATSISGQYALVVPPGTYRLWFYPRSGSFVAKWWTSVASFETADDVVVGGADVGGKNASLAGGP